MSKFFFHYNKPASKRAGHPVMTVHHFGRCLLVRAIVCKVPVTTRERKSQPHVVMAGQGVVRLTDDMDGNAVATITAD
jgi:hypothetical protein